MTVLGDLLVVARDESGAFETSLGHEDAVEWIPVVPGEALDGRGMINR